MFAQASVPLLTRSFFAHHDTKTPVYISLISMGINLALAWWLSSTVGIYGLAAAFSISGLLNMMLLLSVLRIKFGDLDDKRIIQSVWKIMLGALIMAAVIQGLKYGVAPLVNMRTFVGIFIQTVVSMIGGALTYFFVSAVGKFDEVSIIREYVRKVLKIFKSPVKSTVQNGTH